MEGSRVAHAHEGRLIAGKYRLVRRLAVGGMGEVWRARNETTGADVALKVLRDSHDESLDARFRNEARLGAMLSHRGIVRIFDLVEEPDGALVLVMELLRGESLAHYLKDRGTLSTKQAVAIAVPVLSALAHAHKEGVVHRDMTPANVFLSVDPDGYVIPKIVDFGIAKLPVVGTQTLDGRVLGTPRYMSPEQIRGAQGLDGRSDLFSLAAAVHEMIVGASPFEAASPSASLAAVLESPVDPDPRIEPRVWLELQRALSKRPYERHRDAAEMAEALRVAVGETDDSLAALLRGDPPSRVELDSIQDRPPPSRPTKSVEGQSLEVPWRRRSPASWVVGITLGACVALLGAAALRRPAGDVARVPAAAAAAAPQLLRDAPLPASPVAEVASALPSAEPVQKTRPRPAPTRPAAPHPKPIATTPGF